MLDPRKSRKARDFPTTGILITIDDEWFTGDSGPPWRARHQIANALRNYLAYHRSIALPDLAAAVENITLQCPQGHYLLNNSILIYDSIFGGLGLTTHLHTDLLNYATRLAQTTNDNEQPRFLTTETAEQFLSSITQIHQGPPSPRPLPSQDHWWRVIPPKTKATAFSPAANTLLPAIVHDHKWADGTVYNVETPHDRLELSDTQFTTLDKPDWLLWQPSTGRHNDLFLDYEDY